MRSKSAVIYWGDETSVWNQDQIGQGAERPDANPDADRTEVFGQHDRCREQSRLDAVHALQGRADGPLVRHQVLEKWHCGATRAEISVALIAVQ